MGGTVTKQKSHNIYTTARELFNEEKKEQQY